jgi:hypothetical protein
MFREGGALYKKAATLKNRIDADKKLRSAVMAACAKKGLIEEGDRRDLFERVTGLRSLTKMTGKQLLNILDDINRTANHVAHSAKIVQNKVTALWKSAWALGVIEHDTTAALDAFVQRQTGIEKFRWLKARDGDKVIEALKSMLERAGVRWKQEASQSQAAIVHDPARAVWTALTELTDREGVTEHMHCSSRGWDYMIKVSGCTTGHPTTTDYQAAIRALGTKRRKYLADKAVQQSSGDTQSNLKGD